MVQFNFDEAIDRRASNSAKWSIPHKLLAPDEVAAEPLPMWVADMDFRSPPAVVDALHDAVAHGVFGYGGGLSQGYVDAAIGWQRRRFGWDPSPDWLLPSAGVVTALKTAIQTFTRPGDSVLIQPPVYSHFHLDPLVNGRHLALAPLTPTEQGYRFDARVFEAAIRPDTRLFILCNPHNPTGNIWSEDELRTMGEICLRHDILVVSDEIHQDFILDPRRRHVPFAALGPRFADASITCTAPSKTFNLAGLQCANVFVANARLRHALRRQFERNQSPSLNILGMVAAEAAYAHGEPWLEALLPYIKGNQDHFAAALKAAVPTLSVTPTDALYLAWIDCRGLGLAPEALSKFLLTEARLWLDGGLKFGAEGAGFMRINLGCPRRLVDEAIARLTAAVHANR